MAVSPTSVTLAPGGRVRKLYKCSSCSKVFNRSEHCIRHERGHTQERPFTCQFCYKKYARKDLVKRHERTIHAVQYEALQAASNDSEKRESGHAKTASGGSDPFPRPESHSGKQAEVQDAAQSLFQDDSSILGLNLDLATREAHEIPIDPELYSQLCSLPSPLTTNGFHPPNQLEDAPSGGKDVFDLDGLDFLDTMAVGDDKDSSSKRPRLETASTSINFPMPLSDVNGRSHNLQSLPDAFDISLFTDFFALDDTFTMPDLPYTPSNSDDTSPEQNNICSYGAPDTARIYQNPNLDHSQKLFSRLPHVLQDKSKNPPRFEINETTYESFCNDVTIRMYGETCQQILPTIQDFRRFLVGYLDCFHRHLPIIHLPSLVLAETPSPLLLALNCIGALYQLDRRRAALAYQLSLRLLRKFEDQCCPTQTTTPLALWAIQTRILLSYYAFFIGDADLIIIEFQRLGFYLTDYRLRRALISKRVVSADKMTWAGYVQRESHKRALCGINIMSNLAVVVFDVTPGFVSVEHLEFEMPDEEQLWNAKTEEEWRRLWTARDKPYSRSLRSVLTNVVSGEYADAGPGGEQTYHLSTFGGLVLMHAMCIHMWTSLQFTRAVGLYSSVGTGGNFNLRGMVLSNAIATLSRCQKSLFWDDKEGKLVEPSWDASDGPLLFNCQAVLRIAWTRLFLPEFPFQRIVMITGTEDDISEAAAAYVACPLERSDLFTKAAAKACQGFLTPVGIGHLLLRKTAAFSWSVEHAAAAWDSALFLTKWLHTIDIESGIIPPTMEEGAVLAKLKHSLSDMDYPYIEHTSLATAVSRAWAPFLTDVWVWGLTPKMGFALERLATCYEEEFTRLCADKVAHM